MSDEVRRNVERLHDELEQAAAEGNADAGEMLAHTGSYLDADTPTPEDHEALIERIQEAVVRFDADHPSLSGALQGVIDSLTASGI